ncbi:hypothetical protein DdX_19308 [Ditylenchus destructor]|uniref:Uncharacterized protein n=1 Tax=Ditylenchus destructor TaxID=166010 RepID=A0AAD4MJ38_9BILA|nr:hypothetical protein DdX_19308 [Ditylenchus destructor]
MAKQLGDVTKFKKTDYIWDKLPKKPKVKSNRENVELAFMELIKHYVDHILPKELREKIFEGNTPSTTFKVKDEKVARRLSFFLMDQLNLFAILECKKLYFDLRAWMGKHSNNTKAVFNNTLPVDHDRKKYQGEELKPEETEALNFLFEIVDGVSEIGPRQDAYALYMAFESQYSFAEAYPQMAINSGESLGKVELENVGKLYNRNIYSAKRQAEVLVDEKYCHYPTGCWPQLEISHHDAQSMVGKYLADTQGTL